LRTSSINHIAKILKASPNIHPHRNPGSEIFLPKEIMLTETRKGITKERVNPYRKPTYPAHDTNPSVGMAINQETRMLPVRIDVKRKELRKVMKEIISPRSVVSQTREAMLHGFCLCACQDSNLSPYRSSTLLAISENSSKGLAGLRALAPHLVIIRRKARLGSFSPLCCTITYRRQGAHAKTRTWDLVIISDAL
jgi:hypothetical protein